MNQTDQQSSGDKTADVQQVSDFLAYEASLLDERRFEEWMELFDEAGVYWAPASPTQTSPLTEVSIFYDDRILMKQRITRLRHERIHIQTPPSRTVHIVENAVIREVRPEVGELVVTSKFIIVEYRPSVPEGVQRLFAGDYRHTLRRKEHSFTVLEKKAILVNCDAVFAPMALYF